MVLPSRKELGDLISSEYPAMSEEEVDAATNCIWNAVLDLDCLMNPSQFRKLEETADNVENWIEELKRCVTRREFMQRTSLIGNGVGLLGAFLLATPLGPVMLIGGAATGITFGIYSYEEGLDKEELFKKITVTLKQESGNFKNIATAARKLDDAFKSKLKISLFSKNERDFLNGVYHFVVKGKETPCGGVSFQTMLKYCAISEALLFLLNSLGFCSEFLLAAAFPVLNVAMQLLHHVQEVQCNKACVENLVSALERLRRECEVLGVCFKN